MKDFECPFCGETFRFYDESIKSIEDIQGCTCDCPGCGKVLIAENGVFIDALETFAEEMRKEGYDVNPREIKYVDF